MNLVTYIYPRTTVTLESSFIPQEHDRAEPGFPRVTKVIRNDSEFTSAITISEGRILTIPASSADIIERSEQIQAYRELGEALSEMVGLEEDDEWKIDEPVYGTALYIASKLMAAPYPYPAPRIFNHGPDSVVFNWSVGTNNLYLTISPDRISVLSSSPKRIEFQGDYSLNKLPNPVLFLPFIQPDHWGPAYDRIKAVSDPPEPFDKRRYEIQAHPR
jgi:hypothetical protein